MTQFFEGGQNAPCCKEKVKVFPSESLRDQKIDRLCQSLHVMPVSLTYHNSFSCKFWIKRPLLLLERNFVAFPRKEESLVISQINTQREREVCYEIR